MGGERNANNYKELTHRTNIGYILNTATEVTNYFPEEFTYKKVDLYVIIYFFNIYKITYIMMLIYKYYAIFNIV